MKSSLLTFAALGGVSAIVLPAGFIKPLPRGAPELPTFSTPRAVRSVDDTYGFSVPLHRIQKRDSSNFDDIEAFALYQAKQVQRKYGTRQQKRDSQLKKRQMVGLTNADLDSLYHAQVSFGTPPQNFLLSLDTGSSDLWVMDTRCRKECDGSPLFDPSASSTFITSDVPLSLGYGDGSGATGNLAADTVSLAGYQVLSQTFGIIDKADAGAAKAPSSGLIGLAPLSAETKTQATPFWEVLASSGRLPEPVFTLQLSRQRNKPALQNVNDRYAPGGVMTFGTIDPSQYSGPITYVNVTGHTWSVPMDSITVNSKTVTLQGEGSMSLIDTGVHGIAGPPAIVKDLYAQIPGARILPAGTGTELQHYAVPCSSTATISLSFGGRSFSMHPTDFTTGASFSASREHPNSKGKLECLGTLFASTLDVRSEWIIGDSFMKNVFQVYDGGFGSNAARIGFAALKGPTAQTVATTTGAIQTANMKPAASRTQISAFTTASSALPTAQTTGSNGVIGGTGLPPPSLATVLPTATLSLMPGIDYASLNVAAAIGTARVINDSSANSAARSGSAFILAAAGIAAGLAILL